MAKLTPYIFSEDARSQAAFYTEALGGEVLSVMTFADGPDPNPEYKDKVMHLSFKAAGIQFYMSDSFKPIERGNGLALTLEFSTEEEAYAAFDKLAEGGKVIDALKRQFWGAHFGQLEDKYGVSWQVVTEMETPEPS
ncbi:PhnB protein [Paenibacillus sophorae]|uniref:PhnB protein n=1 Tax=Paenibacillus sophorae TaxID=1333845 RepID=A0A1H8MHC3_9BACL|nr:VOC family protein [Paenibacillus sophorae]QWU17812.1 VOC family protein [Paenibacillus sophorae]SEO16638.1 PhnB protein [Paenibacillus sophorae]